MFANALTVDGSLVRTRGDETLFEKSFSSVARTSTRAQRRTRTNAQFPTDARAKRSHRRLLADTVISFVDLTPDLTVLYLVLSMVSLSLITRHLSMPWCFDASPPALCILVIFICCMSLVFNERSAVALAMAVFYEENENTI